MRVVWRSLRFALVGGLAIGAAWLGLDQLGWRKIPADAPFEAQILDPRYTSAAIAAEPLVKAAYKELGAPGLSIAVSVDGRVAWTAGMGWANIAWQKPVNAATIFRIGSTSKAITATALARQVDAGLIDFEAPISRYMPKLPNSEWGQLTARQLTSHTAGLVDYRRNRDLYGVVQSVALAKHYDNVADTLEIFDGNALMYPPGTRFHDSSFDMNLMSAVMQAAEKKAFLQIVLERVLAPLGMTSTAGDAMIKETPRMAVFYRVRGQTAKAWRRIDLSQRWASGGMLSTPSDLTKLCGGWTDPEFLAPKTVATFWEPQRLASGAVNAQGYAHGWRARPDSDVLGRKTSRYHHGGVTAGAVSLLVCYPEKRLGIALNINARLQPFERLSDKEPAIARLFFDAVPAPAEQPPSP